MILSLSGLAAARQCWRWSLSARRRRIRTGRGVPIHLQLRSHRLFSENFEEFAHLVDSATLYHTGALLLQDAMICSALAGSLMQPLPQCSALA